MNWSNHVEWGWGLELGIRGSESEENGGRSEREEKLRMSSAPDVYEHVRQMRGMNN